VFSVREFRDFDLMLKLAETGPLRSPALAGELGLDEYGSVIGRRLGWMRHYGMLDRKDSGEWLLTDAGGRVIHARKRARLLQELNELPEEELIEVMAQVMARYQRGQPMIATMMRREFIFGTRRA